MDVVTTTSTASPSAVRTAEGRFKRALKALLGKDVTTEEAKAEAGQAKAKARTRSQEGATIIPFPGTEIQAPQARELSLDPEQELALARAELLRAKAEALRASGKPSWRAKLDRSPLLRIAVFWGTVLLSLAIYYAK